MWILGTKKFFLLALACILVVLFLLFFNKVVILINTDKEPLLPFGQITREDAVKHIEWAYRNNKPYERFALIADGPRDYAITFYQPNPRDPDISYHERRGGILVFEVSDSQLKLLWESTEDISLVRPTIDIRDITGDGKVEIVSVWSDGKSDILYLYSWDENTFQFITPTEKVTGLVGGSGSLHAPVFGVYRGDIQVKDLNNDYIDEIILLGGIIRDELGNEIPTLDNATIYKFNGTSYELWKEETISQ